MVSFLDDMTTLLISVLKYGVKKCLNRRRNWRRNSFFTWFKDNSLGILSFISHNKTVVILNFQLRENSGTV